jgi:two-component system, chemotaxis family, sensor kinase CheA
MAPGASSMPPEILADFAREVDEIRTRMTKDLLLAERADAGSEPLAKAYKSLARGLHTLKGSAATLGLVQMARTAHQLEDVLAPLARAQQPFPSAAADTLLAALDELFKVAQEAAGLAVPAAAAVAAAPPGPAAAPPTSVAALTAPQAATAPRSGPVAPSLVSSPPPSPPPSPPGSPQPSAPAAEQGEWHVGWAQLSPIVAEVDQLRQTRLRILELRQRLQTAVAAVAASDPQGRTAEARASLHDVERGLAHEAAGTANLVEVLEGALKEICTVPAASVLEPLQRSVRDLCRTSGKEGRLSIVGGELRVDRQILEALRGPLIHLVRNAVDHGIEPPAAREARGKHRAGALVIRVDLQGSLVFLEVSDDGGGLDPVRLRDVAVSKGLMSRQEADALDDFAAIRLIFRPGFSTKTEVTDTSGRGVGMDVVDSEVRALDGKVEVSSVPGQGTRFALAVPARMGAAPFLRVRCGEHELAIPLLSVERIFSMRTAALRGSRSDARIEQEGELIKLQDLGAVLGLRQPLALDDGQPVVLVRSEGRRVGLLVDLLVGEGEATLAPLPEELRALPAYQGAITRARGDLVLVLRPDWLAGARQDIAAASKAAHRVLVVDDSLTARAMHRTSLEAGGYGVHAVASGRQGLEQLRHTTYDVIVCDIGMEEMDGIAFTEQVRADPLTRDIPILLVSGLDDGREKERGVQAGADGFLSKKDCAGGRLLAEVAQVVARHRRAA